MSDGNVARQVDRGIKIHIENLYWQSCQLKGELHY